MQLVNRALATGELEYAGHNAHMLLNVAVEYFPDSQFEQPAIRGSVEYNPGPHDVHAPLLIYFPFSQEKHESIEGEPAGDVYPRLQDAHAPFAEYVPMLQEVHADREVERSGEVCPPGQSEHDPPAPPSEYFPV
jgi:hypothetical protein